MILAMPRRARISDDRQAQKAINLQVLHRPNITSDREMIPVDGTETFLSVGGCHDNFRDFFVIVQQEKDKSGWSNIQPA